MLVSKTRRGVVIRERDGVALGKMYNRVYFRRNKNYYLLASIPYFAYTHIIRPLVELKKKGIINEYYDRNVSEQERQKIREFLLALKDTYIQSEKIKRGLEEPIDYPYRIEPFPHQRIATSLLVLNESYALFMEQGTGKTKAAIDALNYLFDIGEISKTVIFAPLSVVYSGWGEEIKNNVIVPYRVFFAVEGTRYDKKKEIMRFVQADRSKLNFLILGYDFLWRLFPNLRSDLNDTLEKYYSFLKKLNEVFRNAIRKSTGEDKSEIEKVIAEMERLKDMAVGKIKEVIDDAIVSLKLAREVDVVIADESQKIKSTKAARTKAAVQLARCAKRRYILTGTPITNTPEDIYSQGLFIHEFLFASKRQFEAYFLMRESDYKFAKKVLRPDRKEEFRQLLNGFAYIVKKEEVLKDLPDKIFVHRDVLLSERTTKHYLEMENELATLVKRLDESGNEKEIFSYAGSVLAKITRLNQMLSGFIVDEEGRAHEFSREKIDVILDILEERGEKKTVIWGVYRFEIERLTKMLKQKGYKADYITGETPAQRRREIVDKFQNGDLQILVANPGTMGVGTTLTAADAAIYMSLSFKLEDFLQSQDRMHRIGQKARKVEYYVLLSRLHPSVVKDRKKATDTIDRAIYQNLRQKKRITENVVKFAKEYLLGSGGA
jgi:SNF2 family DNA or RNA helicase